MAITDWPIEERPRAPPPRPAGGGSNTVLRRQWPRRGQVRAIAGRAGNGPPPPLRDPETRRGPGKSGRYPAIFAGADAPLSLRGLRLPVPGQPPPRDRVSGYVPLHHRQRERPPARGGASRDRAQRGGRDLRAKASIRI